MYILLINNILLYRNPTFVLSYRYLLYPIWKNKKRRKKLFINKHNITIIIIVVVLLLLARFTNPFAFRRYFRACVPDNGRRISPEYFRFSLDNRRTAEKIEKRPPRGARRLDEIVYRKPPRKSTVGPRIRRATLPHFKYMDLFFVDDDLTIYLLRTDIN